MYLFRYEKENTRIEKIGKKANLIEETNEKINLMDQIINAGDKGYRSTSSQIRVLLLF